MKEIDELLNDIEKYRNKDDLKKYVFEIHNIIGRSSKLIKLSRSRKGTLEKFWQELVPLYIYSQSEFAKDSSLFRIVLGNQKYDAIELENDKERKIEFTDFFDGHKDKKIMEELNNKGFHMLENIEFVDKNIYLKEFEKNVKKKCSKKYLDTKIIFIVSINKLEFEFEQNIEQLQSELINIIKKYDFGSNEVFLMTKKSIIDTDIEKSVIKIE